ncbi:MAG: aspartyl/asparaginyl beta-hydroxylase domain-containing protein [Flavobacteriales bacterium]|nr:aspartyl/asparaginyl beta-hydroxylase domain-containing protein [Flavobacteriales bacterium]
MITKKPWFSFLHEKDTSVVDETYFNPNDFEWSEELERKINIVREELLLLLKSNQKEVKPYFASAMMNAPEKWKSLSFYFWGIAMSKNAINSCPETISLLKNIPCLVSASISIMEPNSEIKPHYGDTDAIYRCHLGVEIPQGLPNCGFRVGYEDRSWENGKLLIFNDAAYHKAWNQSDSRRVILLFDIIKPEYAEQKKWICAKVRGNILWQFISEKIRLFKGKKNGFTKVVSLFFAIIYLLLLSSYLKSALLK